MLQVREPEPRPSGASAAGPQGPPRRRRQLVLALGIAGVVLLVAASVAAITWRPAGGHSTDRVTAAGPSPTVPAAPGEPGEPGAVPTTVAGAPLPGGSPTAGLKAAAPPAVGAAPRSPTAPACTLSTGYPLTIPEAMTAGPDGALWFTQPGIARIGRLTPGGTYSSFAVSDLAGDRNGIATGSDGALWFSQTQRIGRITTSGDVKSYALPNGARPGRMIAGPDGALWFVETNRPAVGRVTTNGDFTEFGLSGDQAPRGITAGPDGAVWVARGNIFRITPAGDVKQYPVAQFSQDNVQAEQASGGIVAGRDSAIWFITQYALHRMTPDGHDTIESGGPDVMFQPPKPPQSNLAVDDIGDFWISWIAAGGSNGGVDRISGQSLQDRQSAKGYPGGVPTTMTTGPDGAVRVGASPSTTKGAPYGPSTILRLTADGTTVVKDLPCPT